MSHIFLMIVEECWVGYNYEGFAPPQHIEDGTRAWTVPKVMHQANKKKERISTDLRAL